MANAKFKIGQIVHHKLFSYRGVIFDIDFQFQGSDDWYEKVARSKPPKDEPWYHVLVDNASHQTYVAERNLEMTQMTQPIYNPDIDLYFSGMENGDYLPLMRKN